MMSFLTFDRTFLLEYSLREIYVFREGEMEKEYRIIPYLRPPPNYRPPYLSTGGCNKFQLLPLFFQLKHSKNYKFVNDSAIFSLSHVR